MQPTEVIVREHMDTQNDTYTCVDMTDDTDGPVTRVTKFVRKEDIGQYAVGTRFMLSPVLQEADLGSW